jgi:hypothetical protein
MVAEAVAQEEVAQDQAVALVALVAVEVLELPQVALEVPGILQQQRLLKETMVGQAALVGHLVAAEVAVPVLWE